MDSQRQKKKVTDMLECFEGSRRKREIFFWWFCWGYRLLRRPFVKCHFIHTILRTHTINTSLLMFNFITWLWWWCQVFYCTVTLFSFAYSTLWKKVLTCCLHSESRELCSTTLRAWQLYKLFEMPLNRRFFFSLIFIQLFVSIYWVFILYFKM